MPLLDRLFSYLTAASDGQPIAVGFPLKSFTYKELAAATNGFSSNNEMYDVDKGKCYRGVISDGMPVAVKQFMGHFAQKEFRNELQILSKLHHRNIAAIIGCCTEPTKLLIVYEFASDRPLSFLLHENNQTTLDWSARVKIANSCAKALEYLHDNCNLRVVHRDVKPSNILVDGSFESKLDNFGLAKVIRDGSVEDAVVGTLGYIDPEYISDGIVTEKLDIYSFGWVLLELITGRRPSDLLREESLLELITGRKPSDLLQEETDYYDLITSLRWALLNDNYSRIVDTRLVDNYNLNEMKQMVVCALVSVHPKRSFRPKISEIVRALEGLSTIVVPDEATYSLDVRSSVPDHALDVRSFDGSISDDSDIFTGR